MWTALFVVAVAAAICFGIAAIIVQSKDKGRKQPRRSAHVPETRSLVQELPASGLPPPLLLVNRMKSLRLDPEGFARLEPIVFQELSVRCQACDSTARCESDLVRNSYNEMDTEWRDFCPNAPTLNMLCILQNCYSTLKNRQDAA